MGQRRLGSKESGKAPKTPKKDENIQPLVDEALKPNEKGLTPNEKAASEGENIGKNGITNKEDVRVDAKGKPTEDTANHNDNDDENAKKEAAEEETGVGGKESLSTSWVVFEENNEFKGESTRTEVSGDEVGTRSASTNQEKINTDFSKIVKQENEGSKIKGQDSAKSNPVVTNKKNTEDESSKSQNSEGVAKQEVEVKGDRPTYADMVKGENKTTTEKPDGVKEDTSKQKSINVLHEVKDGRIFATKQRDIVTKQITDGEKGESEKEKQEKRSEILKRKMESYVKINRPQDKIIDIEKLMFADKVLSDKVLLEDAIICGREFAGVIAISNIEKPCRVILRYTADSWKTKMDEEAVPFTADQTKEEIFARFFFSLFIPFAKSIEFAVKVMSEDGTVWDNQDGKNYCVENVKENDGPGKLIARFTPPKNALFAEHVEKKGLCLKSASLENGRATLMIATNKNSDDPPGVRYTTDDWKSFNDITSIKIKGSTDEGNIYKVDLGVPKEAKLVFVVFWKNNEQERWDNNDGTNFEIQG